MYALALDSVLETEVQIGEGSKMQKRRRYVMVRWKYHKPCCRMLGRQAEQSTYIHLALSLLPGRFSIDKVAR